MSKEEQALTNLLESYSDGRESQANDLNGKKPRGFWQKWSNLRKELRVIIKQVGHFPNQVELGNMGKSGVARAVQTHGGFNAVREKMGYKVIKKAPGHWRDFENIKSTLEGIIVQVGDFPSSNQLRDLGYSGLITGMSDYHGGIRSVREKMGYENETHPNGHWKKWKTVRTELEKLMDELGHFPSKTELTDNGQGSVAAAIQQYHGGITKVKKRMGVAETRKQKGHWEQWKNVRKELNEAIKTIGHFPTQKELLGLGKSSVCVAIGKHHNGINAVREKMGYETEQKTPGYWQDFDVIRRELDEVIGEIGEYPSQKYLLENGHASLVSAIGKNHGGWSKVRSELGYEAPVKPKGFWTDWDNVEEALNDLIQRNGRFPTFIDFKDSEYSTVPGAIKKFHGGMDHAREKLGHERGFTPQGHWKELDNVETVLRDLESRLGHFPSQREMKEAGYSSLPTALTKYHGGARKVAKNMGEKLQLRPSGFWTLKTTKSMCLEYMEEFGDFPTQVDLKGREDKYQGLQTGVNKNGGIARLKRLLKVNSDQKPNGYWNENRVLSESRKLVREHGKFPTQQELNRMGRGDLVGAIHKYSSITDIKKKLGLELAKAEDGYWTDDRILVECKMIVSEHGDLPTKDVLLELGHGPLTSQIERNGGYPHFRKKLGLEARKLPHRFWNEENTYAKAVELYEEHGELPSEQELLELNLSSFPNAAREYFRGMTKLRAQLKEEYGDNKEEKELQKLPYVQDELRRIQGEHELKSIPGQGTLKKLGYTTLISAIKLHHGGFNEVRNSMGEKVVAQNGTWTDPSFVLNEAVRIMDLHGWDKWPGESALRAEGHTMMPTGIRKCYGGVGNFREALYEHLGKENDGDQLERLLRDYGGGK